SPEALAASAICSRAARSCTNPPVSATVGEFRPPAPLLLGPGPAEVTPRGRAVGEFRPPARLLLGPGPSEVHPRVLRAMSAPLLGHLDPAFIAMMEEVKALLPLLFAARHPPPRPH